MCNCRKNKTNGVKRSIVKSTAGTSPSNPIVRRTSNISGRRIITRTIK